MIASFLTRVRRRLGPERGFAMPTVMLLMLTGSMFAAAAWSVTNNDAGQSGRDRDSKQALAAAESGIEYYRYHLNQDNAYWTKCDSVPPPGPGQPNPVNQPGAANPGWRTVPGSSASYKIELVPQNNYTQCVVGTPASMIDGSSGTLQIKATGRAGKVSRTVVATMRHKGFLDFLYFTNYETTDPAVSGTDPTTCTAWRRAGRPSSCGNIVFSGNDALRGPFHTNDDILTCGNPVFGRPGGKDSLEVSGNSPGYADGCGGGTNPSFNPKLQTGVPTIPIPQSNSQLANIADPAWQFTGTTHITLNGSQMTVTSPAGTVTGFPPNGVIYVKSGSCVGVPTYSVQQTYSDPSGCADVYVHGSYNQSFTIASQRDIIVDGDLIHSGNSVAGLIADYFVRVYHPVNFGGGNNGCTNDTSKDLGDVTIDAAILSLQHQFRVDNYNCGNPEGTLTVNGAIAQNFRGVVGQGGATITNGYIKNYNYDDRLKTISPPYFLDPLVSEWRVIRFNEQVPAS